MKLSLAVGTLLIYYAKQNFCLSCFDLFVFLQYEMKLCCFFFKKKAHKTRQGRGGGGAPIACWNLWVSVYIFKIKIALWVCYYCCCCGAVVELDHEYICSGGGLLLFSSI